MRRNLFLIAITWALVVLLIGSCATKNGRVFFGGGWIGPLITGVTFSPAAGPYYQGDSVTFTVAAAPTGGGTLSYAWSFGTWATITAGGTADAATVTLDTLGVQTGTVTVTETLADASTMDTAQDFNITVELIPNHVPVIASLTAVGNAVTAVYSDADAGDTLTPTWSSDVGSVTAGAFSNTGAAATFVPPVGVSGSAVITLSLTDGVVTTPVTLTVGIDFVFDPYLGAVADSVFLLPQAWSVAAGSNIVMDVYAYQNANPLANLNSLRILCDKTAATATGFIQGTFFTGYDGAAILSPVSLQQPTFVDLNVSWGGGTFANSGASSMGVLGTVTFSTAAGGPVTFDIQVNDGTQDRTFYSDLASTKYFFGTVGKDYSTPLDGTTESLVTVTVT